MLRFGFCCGWWRYQDAPKFVDLLGIRLTSTGKHPRYKANFEMLSDSNTPSQKTAWRGGFITQALGGLAVVVIALGYAYWTAFSYFSSYDDEGYALIAVRGFLEGHRLYADIFSFYGPFYFFYQWVLHAVLAVPLNHDATTAICIGHWLVGSATLAAAGALLTRSPLVAFLVFMQMTLHLTPLAREPGHPQELAVLLLCVAVAIAALSRGARTRLAVLVAIGTALVFTKINIGVFYACAFVLALASGNSFFKRSPTWYFMLLVLSSLLPFVLMKPNLHEAWALIFGIQMCVTILASGTVAYVFAEKEEAVRGQFLPAIGAWAVISVALILLVVVKGTPLLLMFHALVTEPARLGSSFSIPLKVPGSLLSSVLAALSAGAAIWFRGETRCLRLSIALAKVVFAVIGLFVMITDYNRELGYLLPWTWLLIVPNETVTEATAFGRRFLCLLSIWQGLQAYPVAGTQVVVGTLLLPLAYGVCLRDAVKSLSKETRLIQFQARIGPHARRLVAILAFGLLFYVYIDQWCNPLAAWSYYASVPPLGLMGARRLHLPAQQSETYRSLAQYLRVRGDSFYTLPGFSSLYFWTGMAPPSYLNIPERLLLNDEQQKRVIDSLKRERHALVVFNESQAPVPDNAGPLAILIHSHCHEIARFDTFKVLELVPVNGTAPQKQPGPE